MRTQDVSLRTVRAQAALDAHCAAMGYGAGVALDERLVDLLCDLRHHASRAGIDAAGWTRCARLALDHFESCSGDYAEDPGLRRAHAATRALHALATSDHARAVADLYDDNPRNRDRS